MEKPTYKVVGCTGVQTIREATDAVVKGVQKYLDKNEGWIPTGGIAVVQDTYGYYHAFQAIIKE